MLEVLLATFVDGNFTYVVFSRLDLWVLECLALCGGGGLSLLFLLLLLLSECKESITGTGVVVLCSARGSLAGDLVGLGSTDQISPNPNMEADGKIWSNHEAIHQIR